MEPFDLLNTPLSGTHLIEASAGTGKTYAIEGLFLRLILEEHLSVDQILVVTFTKAATEELRDRIRRKLLEARNAFELGTSGDGFVREFAARYEHPELGKQLLKSALFDFDQAAIYTIHGFCQRLLAENAFETGSPFDTELISDSTPMERAVSEDYWRHQLYTLPPELIGFAVPQLKGPGHFHRLLRKLTSPETRIIPPQQRPELSHLQSFRYRLGALKEAWSASRDEILSLLLTPALNGNRYGSVKRPSPRRDTGRSEATGRELKLLFLGATMDRYTDPESVGFPLPDEIGKFSASTLRESTRKDQVTPSHPFFHVCEDLLSTAEGLEREMADFLRYLRYDSLDFARRELPARKDSQNVQFYDDLLIRVKAALSTGKGYGIASAVRGRYRAALVDEFQDTDTIQNDIFTRIFREDDSPLFLIGDPKQAIYSFRGADVFSYMHVARQTEEKRTLLENWRSSPALLMGLNTLFTNVADPFMFDGIRYAPARPGEAEPRVDAGAGTGESPFRVWFVDSVDGKPVSKAEGVQRIADAVAGEVLRLVTVGAGGPGAAPSAPYDAADIAVLVRTNRQARIVNAALSAKGIPTVLCNAGNIFDSHEAGEMETVLAGIAEPGNPRLLRSAMVTDMFGISAAALDTLKAEPPWWPSRVAEFRFYGKLWREGGFIRMFRLLMAQQGIRHRLLSLSDGERRITNLLHLAELLHGVSIEEQIGMPTLINWLAEQRERQEDAAVDSEEHQLRLESDEHAVKIVTIHKSKGLEYAVVFCPFGWEGVLRKDSEITFHDPDHGHRFTLDLAPEENTAHRELAEKELLAENLRLLYVSVTRAQQRCYLTWGNIRSADASGLAYLLPAGDAERPEGDLEPPGEGGGEGARLPESLNRLTRRSGGRIVASPLPDGDHEEQTYHHPPDKVSERLFARKYTRATQSSWRIASYSSLVADQFHLEEFPDHDGSQREPLLPLAALGIAADPAGPPTTDALAEFPGGARSGVLFHELFEHLDFAADDHADRESLVAGALDAHGLDGKWTQVLVGMIDKVLSTSLSRDRPELLLSAVPMDRRINEMEFYFPLNPIDPRTLTQPFRDHGGGEIPPDFPERLGGLSFSPVRGFMKGYVDLIFRHDDSRYYLLDWKSNVLGPGIDDYRRDRLAAVMTRECYVLQYHLYVLALHQHLRLLKPDYDYGRDFGGVFYVFIRGVDPDLGPDFGVYSDRPSPDLIHALGSRLIPGFAWP